MKEVKYPLYRRLVGYCDTSHRGTVVEFTDLNVGSVVVPTKGYKLGHSSICWNNHDCPKTWEPVAAPVKRTVQYPNLLVEIFNQEHMKAACNLADKLGYAFGLVGYEYDPRYVGACTVLHFHPSGALHKYDMFTKDEVTHWPIEAQRHRKGYEDFLGSKLVKLRKVQIAFDELNPLVTESKDNQAVLAVVPRPVYNVMKFKPLVPKPSTYAQQSEEAIERSYRASQAYAAAYGSGEFPMCTCNDVDSHTRKTCRMAKAYGGRCYKRTADNVLGRGPRIEWYKPKEDVSLVQKLAVLSVLAFSKIVSVVKRGFNFLRGNK